MKTNATIHWMVTVVALLVAAAPFSASHAAITGQRINPNVLLLIDTGRAMDWVETANINDNAADREEATIAACRDMNKLNPTINKVTPWMQVLDAFLGTIPSSPNNYHCFYENPVLRPAIKSTTITGNMSDNTREYWQFSSAPHFRAVNCHDPREPANRGDWNETYGQCIGSDTEIVGIPHMIMPDGSWCQRFVDGKDNYLPPVKSGDKPICFNLHPKALPRPADGILERYRSLARFGIATFDNLPAPAYMDLPGFPSNVDPWEGMWDYGPNRNWYILKYKEGGTSAATRWWNAGIRGDYPGAVGRLIRISDDFENTNQLVREVLDTVEPNNCSFDAAMMDDVGHYFYDSLEARPAYNKGSDLYFNCRPKVVFFITDGVSPDAVEFPQNYCDPNPPPPPWVASDPAEVYDCPFNSAFTETNELFHVVKELRMSSLEAEPIYLVVIGLNVDKKELGSNPCRTGTPEWKVDPVTGRGYCKPPAEGCLAMRDFTEAECNDVSFARQYFFTTRQYLNRMALEGWPSLGAAGNPYDTSIFRQPPWRSADGIETPIWDICSDDTPLDSNCGGEDGDGEEDGALFAYSGTELAQIIDTILSSLVEEEATATRTELATSDITPPDEEGNFAVGINDVQQYVFNTGYTVRGGKPWKGYLYRQGYGCEFNEPDEESELSDSGGAKDDSLSALHDEMTTLGAAKRTLYAVRDDAPVVTSYNNDPTKVQTGFADDTFLVELSIANFKDCVLGAPSPFCATGTAFLSQVLDHLYGRTGERKNHLLADIYNSSPAILSPPRERVPLSSYQEFKVQEHTLADNATRKMNMEREPMLYVGTSDSVLHSFHVWPNTDKVESWGFVPSPLLGNIHQQFPVRWDAIRNPITDTVDGYVVPPESEQTGGYQHNFGVDGSPVAADVLLYKTEDANEVKYWRSLVVGGLGKGGYGYYALDVTEGPALKPAYRWELSHNRFGYNTDATAQSAFQEMGLALSKPRLAYLYVNADKPGSAQPVKHQQAAVILPGGYISDENGGASTSTGVYVVTAATGKLLRYLKTTVEDDLCDPDQAMLNSNLFNYHTDDDKKNYVRTAQLVGEPVVVNSLASGTVSTEAFIGDDRGRIWRMDMSSTDPADWCLDLYFNTLIAEHYPYQDCMNTTGALGSSRCCVLKDNDVLSSCTEGEIDIFLGDDEYAIDACTGTPCPNVDYPFPRVPILSAPTLVQDEERNTVLLFGTGQIDGLETLNRQRVFSLTVKPEIQHDAVNKTTAMKHKSPIINWWLGEPISAGTLPLGPQPTGSGSLGEIEAAMLSDSPTTYASDSDSATFKFFGLGEKMLGRISVFDEVAYFTTFTPLDKDMYLDACEAGGSKIWGVNYNDPTDFPKMPDIDGSDPDALVAYIERPGELLTGARIVRRPSCQGAEGFTLMVQKVRPNATTSPPSGKADNQAMVTSESVRIQSSGVGFAQVAIDSWALVFDGE
ncbi:MAG: PilC/PilY family type IV pilus protein [Proteobacteria bacterium]|nr:PilC/PilY family type IV pilus protein [Pseudomonadota bacterium]